MRRVISAGDINKIEPFRFIPFDIGQDCSETQNDEDLLIGDQLAELVRQKEEIISQAQTEAEFIRQNAFQQGYEEGYKAGIENSRKDIEAMVSTLRNTVSELSAIRDSILENAESDIVNLTIKIAEKIVGRELKQHPDFLLSLIKNAITMVKPEGRFIIRLNPKDRRTFEDNGLEISAIFERDNNIKIEDDPSVTPGGCLIIGDTNVIDLTYESRLSSIMEALNGDSEPEEAYNEGI